MCAAHLAAGLTRVVLCIRDSPATLCGPSLTFHLGMQAATFDVCNNKANAPEHAMEQHYGKCSNYFDAIMLPAAAL